ASARNNLCRSNPLRGEVCQYKSAWLLAKVCPRKSRTLRPSFKLPLSVRDTRETAMTRPFEGIRVIDVTHVLAGPVATYQLAVLGADLIKVEHPDEPDPSRGSGTHKAPNRPHTGASLLTQASHNRPVTPHPQTPPERPIL